jgi:hypothetical protein
MSPCCLCDCVLPQHMKVGIVEPKETAVAKQRTSKHIPKETNTNAITELLDAVLSMRAKSYQIIKWTTWCEESRQLVVPSEGVRGVCV